MATLTSNLIADFTDWYGWSQSRIVKAPSSTGWASGKYLYVHSEDSDNITLCYSDDGSSWTQEVIYTTTGSTITNPSVLVDSNANTYVLWPSSAGGQIHLALIYKTTGSWSSVETVNYPVASGQFGSVGCCIDKNDKVNVVYAIQGAGSVGDYLVYTIRNGINDWTSTTLKEFIPADVPYRVTNANPLIAADSSGYVHIIYAKGNADDETQYVEYLTNKTGSFVTEQVDGSGRSYQGTSTSGISLDTSGNVYVTYTAANDSNSLDYLTYNVKTSLGWQTKVELEYDDTSDFFDGSSVIIHTDNSISVLWGLGTGIYWVHKTSVSEDFTTATQIQDLVSSSISYLGAMYGLYPSSLINDGYLVYVYFNFSSDIAYMSTYTFQDPINNNSTWNFMAGDTFENITQSETTWSQLPITTENCA